MKKQDVFVKHYDVFVKHYAPSSSLTLSAIFHHKSGRDLQGQGHKDLKLESTERPCHKEDTW